MGWIILITAGVFEVGFTTSMKLSEGFTRVGPTAMFIVLSLTSVALLNVSLKTIPMGTAYAVWTGIGAFGTALIGILYFKDPTSFWRIFFLVLLVASIVGLKLVSPDDHTPGTSSMAGASTGAAGDSSDGVLASRDGTGASTDASGAPRDGAGATADPEST